MEDSRKKNSEGTFISMLFYYRIISVTEDRFLWFLLNKTSGSLVRKREKSCTMSLLFGTQQGQIRNWIRPIADWYRITFGFSRVASIFAYIPTVGRKFYFQVVFRRLFRHWSEKKFPIWDVVIPGHKVFITHYTIRSWPDTTDGLLAHRVAAWKSHMSSRSTLPACLSAVLLFNFELWRLP